MNYCFCLLASLMLAVRWCLIDALRIALSEDVPPARREIVYTTS